MRRPSYLIPQGRRELIPRSRALRLSAVTTRPAARPHGSVTSECPFDHGLELAIAERAFLLKVSEKSFKHNFAHIAFDAKGVHRGPHHAHYRSITKVPER